MVGRVPALALGLGDLAARSIACADRRPTGACTAWSPAALKLQVLRLSLVYALLDKSGSIEERHLRAALRPWDYFA